MLTEGTQVVVLCLLSISVTLSFMLFLAYRRESGQTSFLSRVIDQLSSDNQRLQSENCDLVNNLEEAKQQCVEAVEALTDAIDDYDDPAEDWKRN